MNIKFKYSKWIYDNDKETWQCPYCKTIINSFTFNPINNEYNYCPCCGKKLILLKSKKPTNKFPKSKICKDCCNKRKSIYCKLGIKQDRKKYCKYLSYDHKVEI